MVWIEPTSLGLSPCVDLIAVAEGGNIEGRDDHMGGIVIYDVTDPLNPTRVAEAATAGTDNALEFIVPSQPLVTVDAGTFNGPFLFSVDGIGAIQSEDRFGVFRIFELRQQNGEVEIVPVASRIVNQSANSYAALNSGDPQSTILGSAIDRVPNDVGVPMGVAGFGSQIAYVANNPFIGIQAIAFDDFVTEPLAVAQVDATMLGIYRDVDTLGNKVIAVAQVDSKSRMQIIDPGLAGVIAWEESPTGRATSVLGVEGWQARPELGSEETVVVDLAIASGPGGLGVFAANSTAGFFDLSGIGGVGTIRTSGRPSSVFPQPALGLVVVADGAAGVSMVDLQTPGSSRDSDGDGVDDRVIAQTEISGEVVRSVLAYNAGQSSVVAVAAGADRVYLLDHGPANSSTAVADPPQCGASNLADCCGETIPSLGSAANQCPVKGFPVSVAGLPISSECCAYENIGDMLEVVARRDEENSGNADHFLVVRDTDGLLVHETGIGFQSGETEKVVPWPLVSMNAPIELAVGRCGRKFTVQTEARVDEQVVSSSGVLPVFVDDCRARNTAILGMKTTNGHPAFQMYVDILDAVSMKICARIEDGVVSYSASGFGLADTFSDRCAVQCVNNWFSNLFIDYAHSGDTDNPLGRAHERAGATSLVGDEQKPPEGVFASLGTALLMLEYVWAENELRAMGMAACSTTLEGDDDLLEEVIADGIVSSPRLGLVRAVLRGIVVPRLINESRQMVLDGIEIPNDGQCGN